MLTAGEPKPVITIEEARHDLGLEPDENLDNALYALPLPHNGVCMNPSTAREWLIAARAYATQTGIPQAEEFNRGIKRRFGRLIDRLITEPRPISMTEVEIKHKLDEIETFRQGGMSHRLPFIVHWAVYDGIEIQISNDPEHWGALKDLYYAAAPFKGTKQLWVDSLMTLHTLQQKLKALKPVDPPPPPVEPEE